MEVFDTPHNLLNNIANLWTLGYIISGAIGYMFPDWRQLLLALCVISLPITFMFWRLVESPRWLIQRGRLEEAAHGLTKIARINRPHHQVQFSANNLRNIPRDSTATGALCEQMTNIVATRRIAFNLILQVCC
jgi:MFS family permease